MSNTIISGRDLLMMALVRFYKQNYNAYIQKVVPIIEGKSKISLRLIDWFVTNYSKKYNTIIPLGKYQNHNDGFYPFFNVYISYRQQLKAFSKQQFDPFRRRDRIKFYDKNDHWIETTIGQLNFFKWVLQNNILEYIHENLSLIEMDMMASQKNHLLSSDKNEEKSSNKNNQDKENKRKTKKIKSKTQDALQNLNQISQMANINNTTIGPKVVKFD